MMKLFELKKLFENIESKFFTFEDRGNFNQIEEDLKNRFKVQNIDDLPKELMTAYHAYKEAFTEFKLAFELMNSLIQKYSDTETGDEIEIEVDIQEIVKWYELINRRYIDFNFSNHLAERNQNFPQKLFFETEDANCISLSNSDFSNQFMQSIHNQINDVLITMSGDFNDAEVNKQLG